MARGMPSPFKPGQRWASETEPELGLGTVLQVTERTVRIVYPASQETRQYSLENPPLRRVRFHRGDHIQAPDGTSLAVDEVLERSGLLCYRCGTRHLAESELSGQTSFNEPEERLPHGQVDASETFELRCRALRHQHARRKSQVRGFVGGRIELIPHQLFIAAEVAGRRAPRVLLADEVGLGKTIEACLIVHRLIQTGRIQRVLIVVPEPLLHQWFVELLRRFNLWFRIFDEERCTAIESGADGVNPFLDDQLVLCGSQLLANPVRARQALEAEWEMLVVDEAHHLSWEPGRSSPEYNVVEALAARTPSVLLLTATPEQLGVTSHFARLRLLDPSRYYDLEAFQQEVRHYREVAAITDKLCRGAPLSPEDTALLGRVLGRDDAGLGAALSAVNAADTRNALIAELIDRHGTGRVMFRNTRTVIAGFPARIPRLKALPAEAPTNLSQQLGAELAADLRSDPDPGFAPDLRGDPRIQWLAGLLRELAEEKVLLICRSPQKVQAIDEALRARVQLSTALFHEGLPLVQRDRNAAWFAEQAGARILLASEIGSEGRNFQFAHHLVLFDLPPGPELLEQRIGRLDRIGQRSRIYVHVPYVARSPQEPFVRWYDEGLNAFAKNLRGGHELWDQFGPRLVDLALSFPAGQAGEALEQLIRETRTAGREIATHLEQGRDRLLELNSFRPARAGQIMDWIRQADDDNTLEEFMLSVFDEYNIQVELVAPRTYHLGSAGVFADSFPGLPSEGLTVTLDRREALVREDIQFLTWDHPLATGALDLILGSSQGNSAFALWPDQEQTGLYLEAVFVLECVAPRQWHADRFLPPTPIRVVLDSQGEDATHLATSEWLAPRLKTAPPPEWAHTPEFREEILPQWLERAEDLARAQTERLIADALAEMNGDLRQEILRLKDLQAVNPSVSPREIEHLIHEQQALAEALAHPRLRLDALRLMQRGPAQAHRRGG